MKANFDYDSFHSWEPQSLCFIFIIQLRNFPFSLKGPSSRKETINLKGSKQDLLLTLQIHPRVSFGLCLDRIHFPRVKECPVGYYNSHGYKKNH